MAEDRPIQRQDQIFGGIWCTCASGPPENFDNVHMSYSEGSIWTVINEEGECFPFYVFEDGTWHDEGRANMGPVPSPLMNRSLAGNTNSPADQWSAWVYAISDEANGPGA